MKLSNKATLSFFDVIIVHLLPLTNYLVNGQYAQVQPIDSNFAERCICTILTTKSWLSKCSFALSKLRFFELHNAASKREQRPLADYAERER